MRRRSVCTLIAIILLAPVPAAALYFEYPDADLVLDLPIGWRLSESSNGGAAADSAWLFEHGDVRAELFVSRSAGATIDEALDGAAESVGAAGDVAVFDYAGEEAFFSDVELSGDRSGYLMAIEVDGRIAVLFVTAPSHARLDAEEELLSVADSLVPVEPLPGPVSVFFEGTVFDEEDVEIPFPGPNGRGLSGEIPVTFSAGPNAVETGHILVSREATILERYEFTEFSNGDGRSLAPSSEQDPKWLRAWRRYFRRIYRDSYLRVERLADEIDSLFDSNGTAEEERADVVLSWLQSFEFRQAQNPGLFQTTAESLMTASGDCDSLAVIYVALLDHLGIEAQLLVSTEHGHAIAIVDSGDAASGNGEISGEPKGTASPAGSPEGGRFEIEGREFLPAEMTATWPLGKIAAGHADAAGWHVVDLR